MSTDSSLCNLTLAVTLVYLIHIVSYTNGEVKLWNALDQLDVIFQPSNTSLVVDESTEDGTISNNVSHVGVSEDFVIAGYRQGKNLKIFKIYLSDTTQ